MGPRIAVVDANQIEIATAASVFLGPGVTWTLAGTNVNGESVPLTVYKDKISYPELLRVYYTQANCIGDSNAYVTKASYNDAALGIVNLQEFLPSKNGQSIYKVDTSTEYVGGTQSYRQIRIIKGVGATVECLAGSANQTLYPLVYFGDLPASAPPYSLQIIED
jgi:hypothetical protein